MRIPLQERLGAQLMLDCTGTGSQGAALAGIREIRELLMDGLGIEPCKELHELQYGILAHDPVPESVSAETPRSSPAIYRRHNLLGWLTGQADRLDVRAVVARAAQHYFCPAGRCPPPWALGCAASADAQGDFLGGLAGRRLRPPLLAISDGAAQEGVCPDAGPDGFVRRSRHGADRPHRRRPCRVS